MDYKKNNFNISVAFILVLVLVASCFVSAPKIYANASQTSETQASKELGLLIASPDLVSGAGFLDNYIYLTAEEMEQVKDTKTPADAGLGDSWISNKLYSSFSDHGTPSFGYYITEGLEINKMFDTIISGGAASITKYFVFAADNFSKGFTNTSLSAMKYFEPGDYAGTSGAFPIIAMYKGDSPSYTTKNTGELPVTADRIAKGKNILMIGQEAYDTENHCQFVKYANAIIAEGSSPSNLTSIQNGHNVNMLSLNMMMTLGIYTSGNLEGIPLSEAASKLNIDRFMASYSTNRVKVEDNNGNTAFLSYSDYISSFIAWDYADGRDAPAGQTGMYALYKTTQKNDPDFCDLEKITVVDEKGNVVTGEPVKPEDNDSGKDKINIDQSAVTKPARTKITSIKKRTKTSVRIKFKKIKGANGYQIVYGRNKKITKGKKIITVKKGSTKSKVVKKLKKNRKYYFKVRAYKIVNGKKIYGKYSKVKSFKLK